MMRDVILPKGLSLASVEGLRELATRVLEIQEHMVTDTFGRPTALIDPRVVQYYVSDSLDSFLDDPPLGSSLPINYLEGYPTSFGTPVWERLEGEPAEYYDLFKQYRQLREVTGSRSMHLIALRNNLKGPIIHNIGTLYHWKFRSIAFDQYKEQEREESLARQQVQLLGRHREVAEQLLNLAEKRLMNSMQELSPKDAIKLLSEAVQLGRLSHGLEPKTITLKTESNTATGGTPAINIQNNITQTDTSGKPTVSITTKTQSANEDTTRLSVLLNVLEQVGVLQEGIIEPEYVEVDEDD